MEKKEDIEISILKGDKLFNKNTPFVINLISHQEDENEKKCNADLICVIDISGSMYGHKIEQVKQSLKILIGLMDEKERICLILFDDRAQIFFELNYLTKANKEILNHKIDKIKIGGGTNILSGLEQAINVLKRINMITRSYQIQSLFLNLVKNSVQSNLFNVLNENEQNDILDTLYEIAGNNSPISKEASEIYTYITQ